MLKTLIRAFLVLRLESRPPALTMSTVLAHWRTRPAIHYTLDETSCQTRSSQLKQKLDEVYPF